MRVTLTRGASAQGPAARRRGPATLLIHARPIQAQPAEQYRNGARLIISTARQNSANPLARHKTLSYLLYLLARQEATDAGANGAILLNEHGQVAEESVSNVFLARGGALLTPPAHCGLLPGITRGAVLELARAERNSGRGAADLRRRAVRCRRDVPDEFADGDHAGAFGGPPPDRRRDARADHEAGSRRSIARRWKPRVLIHCEAAPVGGTIARATQPGGLQEVRPDQAPHRVFAARLLFRGAGHVLDLKVRQRALRHLPKDGVRAGHLLDGHRFSDLRLVPHCTPLPTDPLPSELKTVPP